MQLSRTNGTGIGLPTFFLTIQLKSINLARHIAFTVVLQQCIVILVNKICESMQKEIIANNVKFEKQVELYQCPIQNPMEKTDHMKHVLYLMMRLLIFTDRNSALLEKLYGKNLQSAQLIESATLKRISFRLFVKTIYHFIQHLSQYNYVKMLALAIKP